MAESDEAIIRRIFAAYNAHDHDTLAPFWMEETVWAPSITGGDTVAGGEYVGLEGLTRYFTELDDVWTSFGAAPLEIDAVRPGYVLVRSRLVGEGRTSGAEVEMENWLAFVLDGGRVKSIRACATRADALEVLERS